MLKPGLAMQKQGKLHGRVEERSHCAVSAARWHGCKSSCLDWDQALMGQFQWEVGVQYHDYRVPDEVSLCPRQSVNISGYPTLVLGSCP